ncbi:MAG TPA: hypothetical protein VIT01_21795 [Acidimicrobiales bacterium]|jgi:hypothetical protein
MKRLVKLVTLAAVIAAIAATLRKRPAPPSASPTAPPTAGETLTAPAATPKPVVPAKEPWAAPTADGGCPDGYPVKAKLKSKIFHVAGGVLYERTIPDRCYASAQAAEADGLRASLR